MLFTGSSITYIGDGNGRETLPYLSFTYKLVLLHCASNKWRREIWNHTGNNTSTVFVDVFINGIPDFSPIFTSSSE